MSIIKVTLPPGELPVNGKQVTFRAPCDCTTAEAVQIEGVNYTICDALGRCVTGKGGVWAAGEIISIILDTESNKAFIQNGANGIVYTATVTNTWVQDGSFYYQDVSVPGLLETDTPVVDILPGIDAAANKIYSDSFCKVLSIETNNDSIRVWAVSAITTAFPIQIKVV